MGLIRLLLAISVFCEHVGSLFGLRFVGGTMAVESFFMISGFYIAMVLHKKYSKLPSGATRFLFNRAFRLYPAYWTVILCLVGGKYAASLFTNISFQNELLAGMNAGSAAIIFLGNLLIFGQDLFAFLGYSPETGSLFFVQSHWFANPNAYTFVKIPQAWSLTLELTFYLLAPFLVTRSTRTLLILAGLSVAVRMWIQYGLKLPIDPWVYRFFPSQLALFLVGVICYRMDQKGLFDSFKKPIYSWTLLVAVVIYIMTYSLHNLPGKELLLLGMIFASVPIVFPLTKSSKLDDFLGHLSYPVYICHMAVSFTIIMFIPGMQSWLLLIATLVFSVLLHLAIERPIQRIRILVQKPHPPFESKISASPTRFLEKRDCVTDGGGV